MERNTENIWFYCEQLQAIVKMSKTFSLFVFGLKKCLFIRTTAISRLVHFYSMPHLFPSTPMFENRKICSSIWNEKHLNFLYLILLNFGVLKRFVERVHLPLAFCCLNTDNHLSFCLHMYTTHSVHNLHSWVNLKYPQCYSWFSCVCFIQFSFALFCVVLENCVEIFHLKMTLCVFSVL